MIRGTVYLVHFDESKVRGKMHYVGFTRRTSDERLALHLRGDGASFFRDGARCSIVRTWPNETMRWELKLKKSNNLKNYCPVCDPRALRFMADSEASEASGVPR